MRLVLQRVTGDDTMTLVWKGTKIVKLDRKF